MFQEREWSVDVNRLEMIKKCSFMQILFEYHKYFLDVENNTKVEI